MPEQAQPRQAKGRPEEDLVADDQVWLLLADEPADQSPEAQADAEVERIGQEDIFLEVNRERG